MSKNVTIIHVIQSNYTFHQGELMILEIKADYSQTFLFPPSLEDWVPLEHPVRFIRLFVESLDLEAIGFKSRESEEGRPNYSNELLLKVWLYGYYEKIRSTRNLEKACKNQLSLVWLTGMNFPDHNSIWRFFNSNIKALKQIFSQSVKLAHKFGMVGLVLQAIDGTKIMADVSMNRSLHKQDLSEYMKKLEESIDEVIEEIKSKEAQESGSVGYRLPHHLQDKSRLKKLIENGLEELSRGEKLELKKALELGLEKLSAAGVDHLNLTAEDSRLMKHKNGQKCFSYNAQSAVDSQEGIITGAKVCTDAEDRHQLCGMVEESASNVGEVSEESLADGGYFCGEELSKAADKGYEVSVNLPKDIRGEGNHKYHKSNFRYDGEKDVYRCPEGEELFFYNEKPGSGKSYRVRIYRCVKESCSCRSQCTRSKRGREIERTPYEEAINKQVRKQADVENKKLLRLRKEIVEPMFGWINRSQGFQRWSFRNLEAVDTQWKLLCTIINLHKMYRKWVGGKVCFG
jgi:transposase